VVLCGDALIDLDLTAAVKWHKAKGAIATVVMQSVPREEVSSYGVVVTDESDVKAFQEKPSVEELLARTSTLVFACSIGIYSLVMPASPKARN